MLDLNKTCLILRLATLQCKIYFDYFNDSIFYFLWKFSDECEKVNCDRAFFVESFTRFTNPDTLKILIEQNRSTIAPLLKRPDELWSNFWGAVSSNGYYKRSDDYMEIVKNEKQGIWNAPFISSAILFSSDRLKKLRNAWKHDTFDPDIAVANVMREKV